MFENLMLKEDGDNFKRWSNPPVPLIMTIYVFNISNPANYSKGELPIMQEVGPFVFTEIRKKEILKIEEATITFRDHKTFIFDEEKSAGSLDQMIYTVNVPLIGLAAGFKQKLSTIAHWLITNLLNTQRSKYSLELLEHLPVRKLLFEGYKVQLFEDLTKLVKTFKPSTADIMPNNTFGLLYGKNNSGEGVYKVYSGVAGMENFTKISTWNNISTLTHWDDKYCNMINGSDGAQFPPPVSRKDTLYVYNPDLCRSVYIQYEKDVTVRGIPAYRFITPKKLFATPSVNPDNKCYCTVPDQCHRSGLLLLASCRKGAPVVLSAPHFYNSDKDILESMIGLNPTKEKHETFADIEPSTGVVINAARRIQINVILEKFENFAQFENLPGERLMPLIWLTESAQISKELSDDFKARVKTPVKVGKIILIVITVLGVVLLLSALAVGRFLIKWNRKETKVIKCSYQNISKCPQSEIIELKKNENTSREV